MGCNLKVGTITIGVVFLTVRLASLIFSLVNVDVSNAETTEIISLVISGVWILFDIALIYGAAKEEKRLFHYLWIIANVINAIGTPTKT